MIRLIWVQKISVLLIATKAWNIKIKSQNQNSNVYSASILKSKSEENAGNVTSFQSMWCISLLIEKLSFENLRKIRINVWPTQSRTTNCREKVVDLQRTHDTCPDTHRHETCQWQDQWSGAARKICLRQYYPDNSCSQSLKTTHSYVIIIIIIIAFVKPDAKCLSNLIGSTTAMQLQRDNLETANSWE